MLVREVACVARPAVVQVESAAAAKSQVSRAQWLSRKAHHLHKHSRPSKLPAC